MSATPEKRPTSAVERWFAVVDTVFDKNKERWAEVGYAHFIAQVEQAERAARGDALEDAARVPAEAGLYGIVDRIRALKASAPPPAPPPPQVSEPATWLDPRVGVLVRSVEDVSLWLGKAEHDIAEHARRLSALESPAAPRAASEVERARADVAQAVRILCGDWNRGAKVGDMAELINNLARKFDRLARLDAAKGGAA